MKSSRRFSLAAVIVIPLLAGCTPGRTADEPAERSRSGTAVEEEAGSGAGATGTGGAIFTDGAREAGLDFVHASGASGRFYIPEILAPGVALFDFDNDNDLDVFVVQGRPLAAGKSAAAQPDTTGSSTRSRLFRNDTPLNGSSGTIRFTDVTAESHLDITGYPMGAATGDFDNDGCVDLFVTELGVSQLFRNQCNGTFADVTTRVGLDASGWAVSASFIDYDRDGWLDLYVGNYVLQPLDEQTKCRAPSGEPDYCSPQAFRAQPDRLYHNGRGRFSDVSATALVGGHFGPALGVSTADFDNDGWVDIFVANDGEASQLWMNQGDGTFRDAAFMAGVAVGAQGAAEGNMGVDAGDFDDDGDEDLFDTVLPGQGNNLWANDGRGVFEDRSTRSGLAAVGLGLTGFGTAWLDYDNDGWLDLLMVNGAVSLKASRRPEAPYAESKMLFRNLGNGRFEDVTRQAGEVFALHEVSRGAAFGDIDNDGDTDVLVGNTDGPLRLLVNNVGNRQHWLGLCLVEEHGRPAIGARVSIAGVDGRTRWRRSRSDGSYASANDPRVLVGLGAATAAPDVRVMWPGGRVEEWSHVTIDRYVTLKQGTGRVVSETGALTRGAGPLKRRAGT